jgi:hypothetical protein
VTPLANSGRIRSLIISSSCEIRKYRPAVSRKSIKRDMDEILEVD